jgi:hypothetical protein
MKRSAPTSAEPLARFVDEYLAYLYETHPTAAAFDGVHLHDDLLEDLSRAAIDTELRELGGWARRLDGINPSSLTGDEKLERRMLAGSIQARLFALEEERPWQRNPLHYAETLAASLASQVLFAHTPVADRARRVVSKLRQMPRFLEAARQNITDPPGLFAKVGIESFDGVLSFVEHDLPKAFRDLEDMHLLGDLADASTVAVDALRGYLTYLRDTVAPRTRASFRLGPERFTEKLRLEEGIEVPVERLLKIAQAELEATQEEFKKVASRANGNAAKVWQELKGRHPSADELLGVVEGQLDELVTFIRRKRIVTIPEHESLIVAPSPEFYRWTFASLWPAGVFEPKGLPAYYYLTNVDPAWPAERQEQHLRDFSYATLWSISSFVEGWAHYCEQMMLDEGFERNNTEIKLGQLAEALVRLARTIVGIRLHTEDLSVERGVRFFRDEAFLEESSARREAERGTFDPSYVLYALGKRMLLKLRADYEAAEGDAFSLHRFHDRLLGQGGLPFWMHRELMLGEVGSLLE